MKLVCLLTRITLYGLVEDALVIPSICHLSDLRLIKKVSCLHIIYIYKPLAYEKHVIRMFYISSFTPSSIVGMEKETHLLVSFLFQKNKCKSVMNLSYKVS